MTTAQRNKISESAKKSAKRRTCPVCKRRGALTRQRLDHEVTLHICRWATRGLCSDDGCVVITGWRTR